MTEETYDAKALAVELGFSEEEATLMAMVNVGEAKLRRLAESRKLARAELPKPTHQHYYRADGTCACGAKRRVRVAKAKHK